MQHAAGHQMEGSCDHVCDATMNVIACIACDPQWVATRGGTDGVLHGGEHSPASSSIARTIKAPDKTTMIVMAKTP
jgi:hypothetical protein